VLASSRTPAPTAGDTGAYAPREGPPGIATRLNWIRRDLHWRGLQVLHALLRPGFQLGGRRFRYAFDHKGVIGERAIEIPLARFAIRQLTRPLEVGCVLSHYGLPGHQVIDLYERCGNCMNVDAAQYDFSNPEIGGIVSISTLEHIGWDGPEGVAPSKSPTVLERIVTSGHPYFVSFPLGYNPHLTRFVETQIRAGPDCLFPNLAVFGQRWLDRWARVDVRAPGAFERFAPLSRRPTKFVAFVWKGIDF